MEYLITKESSSTTSWALYKRQRGHKAWQPIATGLTEAQAKQLKRQYTI